MSSGKIKVGFVGTGGMGQAAHLRAYAGLREECEITALAELRPALAQAVARRYDVPRVYTSGSELLANEKVDAIVAAQPFTRHGILISELARADIPIFTEKPIARSVQVGERILETLAERKTWIMVGYHKRSDPASVLAKATIEELKQSGEIGKMRYIRITMPPGDYIAGAYSDLIQTDEAIPELEWDPPVPDLDATTGRAYELFVNYYIHQINLLRFLLGESYRVTYADPAKVLFVAHSESGIPCTIEMSPYGTSVEWHESALVTFERGYVRLGLPAPLAINRPGSLEIYKDPRKGVTPIRTCPQLPWVHAMRNQAHAFIRAVRGEAPAPCLAEEAVEDLRVARDYMRLLTGF